METVKLGQAVVMETNVKILVTVLVVALVLAGIFLFGDRISSFYKNIIPRGEVIENPEDDIIPGGEIEYIFQLPGEISRDRIGTEELSIPGISAILLNTILEVRRGGKAIVKSNFNPVEDLNPRTEKIEILFKRFLRDAVRVELVYNAKEKGVEAKYFKGGSSSFSYLSCGQVEDASGLNNKEKRALKGIVCARGLGYFVLNVTNSVEEGYCKIKIDGTFVDKISGEGTRKSIDKLLLMLIEGRLNYLRSWREEGPFSDGSIRTRYSCNVGGRFVPCTLTSEGEFLEVEYLAGDEIFYLKEKEVWRMKYPQISKMRVNDGFTIKLFSSGKSAEEIENHCISSIEKGATC